MVIIINEIIIFGFITASEVNHLKMEVETLTAACKEKDKNIRELQQTLVKFKRVSTCLNHSHILIVSQVFWLFVHSGDGPLDNLIRGHHQS